MLMPQPQRAMGVEPDCHLIIRPNRHEKAQLILERSGRVHTNLMLRFNANSLGALFTEKPVLGISSVPSLVFDKPIYDYVWDPLVQLNVRPSAILGP